MFKHHFGGWLNSTREILNCLTKMHMGSIDIHSTSEWYECNIQPYLIRANQILKLNNFKTNKRILVLEITTRKVVYRSRIFPDNSVRIYGNPININTYRINHLIRKKTCSQLRLTDNEIYADLEQITVMAKKCGYSKIIIIPHINLISKRINALIPERSELIECLKKNPSNIQVMNLLN